MSYFGIKLKYKTYGVLVRIHGPLETFEVDPKELEDTSYAILENHNGGNFNMLSAATALANNIAAVFCNGTSMLWTEVHIDSGHKMICGSSAAKLDVQL